MKAASSVLLSLSIFVAVACADKLTDGKRSDHAKLAHNVRAAELGLQERGDVFGPGRMTFYDVGM